MHHVRAKKQSLQNPWVYAWGFRGSSLAAHGHYNDLSLSLASPLFSFYLRGLRTGDLILALSRWPWQHPWHCWCFRNSGPENPSTDVACPMVVRAHLQISGYSCAVERTMRPRRYCRTLLSNWLIAWWRNKHYTFSGTPFFVFSNTVHNASRIRCFRFKPQNVSKRAPNLFLKNRFLTGKCQHC